MTNMRRVGIGIVAASVAALFGCAAANRTVPVPGGISGTPRNIIVIIGDGMGPQQLALSELYWHRTQDVRAKPLHEFLTKAQHGMHLPLPYRSLVNDSACAASQLAGGCSCEPKQIGMSVDGSPCRSVVREARNRGMKVGVVSDTRLTHATPAAFYGYVDSREREDELAKQLVAERLDLALSGGADFFLPEAISTSEQKNTAGLPCGDRTWGRRKDTLDLLSQARKQGSQVVCSLSELNTITRTPLLGVFSPQYMANAFREGEDGQPTLSRMTERALELLTNPKGFFLMVEAGQIDTAGHYNDAGWVLAEMLRLNSVVRVIDAFVQNHPDTLVVLTADHETGGMGLSYRRSQRSPGSAPETTGTVDFLSERTLRLLKDQGSSIVDLVGNKEAAEGEALSISTVQEKLAQATGVVVPPDELRALLKSGAPDDSTANIESRCADTRNTFYPYTSTLRAVGVARRIGESQGVVWATGTHTTTPVTIAATGPTSENFRGWMNTEHVGQRLLEVLQSR